jgi:hypothetical protein
MFYRWSVGARMKSGDLVQCKRTKAKGMIVSIKDSSDYTYPEIMWFSTDTLTGDSKKITSRGFETLEKIDDN